MVGPLLPLLAFAAAAAASGPFVVSCLPASLFVCSSLPAACAFCLSAALQSLCEYHPSLNAKDAIVVLT